MSNQKITKLRLLTAAQVATGDRIPIVDVSEQTSPTGETKEILVSDLMIFSSGVPEFTPDNGLSFDPTVTPGSDSNLCCYAQAPSIPGDFTLMVKAFVPQTITTTPQDRVIFGIGPSPYSVANQANATYIGISNSNLVAYISGSSGSTSKRTITASFDILNGKPFMAAITKNTVGGVNTFSLYINGGFYSSIPCDITLPLSFVNMGCGNPSQPNLDVIIYDAQIFNKALSDSEIVIAMAGKIPVANLISSYRSNTLNAGPTQWLDGMGTSHLLLPVTGAEATNPSKDFHLRFYANSSGYLGNGTARPVLPNGYILKNGFVYSDGDPILSIGSGPNTPPLGASGIYTWNNNRVPMVNLTNKRNPLTFLNVGISHIDRTLYVNYQSSTPCIFNFDGYIDEYGSAYVPLPTPTPSPTAVPTPTPLPPTPTPTLAADIINAILLQDGSNLLLQDGTNILLQS